MGTSFSLLLFTVLSSGQMTTRSLTGTVTDGHHEPLKGAVIEIENDVTETVVSYIAGVDGRYSFKRLNGQSEYRLWATYRGKRSKVRRLSQFDSDRPKIVDLVIKPRE